MKPPTESNMSSPMVVGVVDAPFRGRGVRVGSPLD